MKEWENTLNLCNRSNHRNTIWHAGFLTYLPHPSGYHFMMQIMKDAIRLGGAHTHTHTLAHTRHSSLQPPNSQFFWTSLELKVIFMRKGHRQREETLTGMENTFKQETWRRTLEAESQALIDGKSHTAWWHYSRPRFCSTPVKLLSFRSSPEPSSQQTKQIIAVSMK